MYGGLKKSASRLALVAAAGVLSTGAYAADLGGDCCADLEERVAELEATTARKGNRKVSLQVWGSVHKTILGWNDGTQSNTYLGVDNINYATRFGFRGDAKISPSVKAGYSIMIDINTGASSAVVSQVREEAPGGCAITTTATGAAVAGQGCGATSWTNDHGMRMRDANWWIEHNSLGRLTMGRLTVSGPQGTIDLGGIGNVASGSQSLAGGGFLFRSAGVLTGTSLAAVTDNLADYNNRVDGVKWDSPTFAGFVVGASIGEAGKVDRTAQLATVGTNGANAAGPIGQLYAVNARYAGEYSGVRVAAAVGYEVSKAEETMASNLSLADSKNTGLSLSLMHTPTGLFAQGHWLRMTRGNVDSTTTDTGTNWLVQAGISQNWFGVGKTALYGEYSRANNMLNAFTASTVNTAVGDTRYTMWGVGVTQDLDAAAMQLYAGYRNHSLNDATGLPAYGDIGIWMAGARINF